MTTPWGAIIGAVGSIADDLITTAEEKRRLDIEERKIEAGLLQGQAEINKAEAAHPSLFVAGWRPAVGWVGAISLAMVYIPKAVVLTGIWTYQAAHVVGMWDGKSPLPPLPVYPDLGVTDLIALLGSMLGFGVLRSWDKGREVDTRKVE